MLIPYFGKDMLPLFSIFHIYNLDKIIINMIIGVTLLGTKSNKKF